MANFTLTGIFTDEIEIPTATKTASYKRYIMIDITNVPTGIPMSVNPRSQNMASKAVKAMKDGLNNHNTNFPLLNGGIKIVCRSIKVIGGHDIIINIDDDRTQGIVDGGHTYRTICEFLSSNQKYKSGVTVFFELMYGDHCVEQCVDIAAARNTASQVKLISIMNAQGKFDQIKKTIDNLSFANDVIWEENDDGYIKGEFLIALLQLFNIYQFSKKTGVHPCDCYNSFDNCLKTFNRAYTNCGGLTDSNPFTGLVKMIVKLCELHDYVQTNIPRWYNSNQRCNYGSICEGDKTYASISKNKGKCKSFLFKEDMPYYVPQMFVFPILTTARHILKVDKDGELIWKMNPYTFLEIVGPNATMTLLKGMSEYKDRHKYMKLPDTWRNVYGAARDAYNDSREED